MINHKMIHMMGLKRLDRRPPEPESYMNRAQLAEIHQRLDFLETQNKILRSELATMKDRLNDQDDKIRNKFGKKKPEMKDLMELPKIT